MALRSRPRLRPKPPPDPDDRQHQWRLDQITPMIRRLTRSCRHQLPVIALSGFFAHFIKGMCTCTLCLLIICKQLTSLSMELSSVAYEAYRALVQAQSPTWLVDEAGSVHDGDLRTAQHFAGSI